MKSKIKQLFMEGNETQSFLLFQEVVLESIIFNFVLTFPSRF